MFGMAAYASYGVGQALQKLQIAGKWAPGLAIFGNKQTDLFAVLGAGNLAIFLDASWIALAYEKGGINEVKKLSESMSNTALTAWENMDAARSEKDGQKRFPLMTKGTKGMVEQEQTILQEVLDAAGKNVVKQMGAFLQANRAQVNQMLFPGADWGLADFGSFKSRVEQILGDTGIFRNFLFWQSDNADKVNQFIAKRIEEGK